MKISEYKRLPIALTYPGSEHFETYHSSYARIDTFKSPFVRFAPGLSLTYLQALPEQIGIAIDGDRTEVITHAGSGPELDFVAYLPSALSYEIAAGNSVLVIDPKGGLPLLTARYYGFQSIHGIERNPLLYHVIKQDYDEFSGGIYNRNVLTGFGRNYLEKLSVTDNAGTYDLIDIPVENTSVGGVFGITEDYKYTTEAIKTYIKSLSPDGILSINLYLIPPPRTELRLLATIMDILYASGTEKPEQRVAAIRSWDTVSILVKNSYFTQEDIERIRKFCLSRRFDPVYYPGIRPEETNVFVRMQSNDYWKHFNNIIKNNQSYIENYLFDITPVHDDNPFFHYFLKLRNIYSIYDVMGRKFLYFINEGYLLPVILAVIILLSLILIISPVLLMRGSADSAPSYFGLTLLYFSMIGIGFMFVEIALIQKSILLIENPALSISSVLASLLVSSGAGSLFSARNHGKTSVHPFIILCMLIAVFSSFHPLLFKFLSFYAMPYKITGLILMIFPLGFFMGIPFPTGLKLIGRSNQALIPWAWAVNACFSVLSPVLFVMIAISTGYYFATWIAVAAYATAYISLTRLSLNRRHL